MKVMIRLGNLLMFIKDFKGPEMVLTLKEDEAFAYADLGTAMIAAGQIGGQVGY